MRHIKKMPIKIYTTQTCGNSRASLGEKKHIIKKKQGETYTQGGHWERFGRYLVGGVADLLSGKSEPVESPREWVGTLFTSLRP